MPTHTKQARTSRRFLGGLSAGLVLLAGASNAEPALEQVSLTDIRGMRYCEILLLFDDEVVIYNTSANNGCPEAKWQAMDVAAIASENGANAAQLNGPKFWTMDEQTILLGDTKTFGGIDARYGATLPISALGASEGSTPYAGFTSSKEQTFVFKAGLPVYELVDASGDVFVLNAYGAGVRDGDPANLAEQLSLAEGWSFQVSTPSEDLVMEPPSNGPTHMVGDDMHQYYTRLD